MIGNGDKSFGKIVKNNIDGPIQNGISSKEFDGDEARSLASRVVESVVRLAPAVAGRKVRARGCHPQRLPTIQVDTVPTPPPSPLSSEEEEEGVTAPEQVEFEIEEQSTNSTSEELRESLRSFIEDILSKAMVVAEKKLKFVGLDDEDDYESPEASTNCCAQHEDPLPDEPHIEPAPDEAEVRATAERFVEGIIAQATEEVERRFAKELEGLEFPITFDEAPEYVKQVASSFIKEVVGRAIALAEEKAVPTIPFNFEDVNLMKADGPWYVRVREALVRVLRTACFCTPRRDDT